MGLALFALLLRIANISVAIPMYYKCDSRNYFVPLKNKRSLGNAV